MLREGRSRDSFEQESGGQGSRIFIEFIQKENYGQTGYSDSV
jgi:hypothetical protein